MPNTHRREPKSPIDKARFRCAADTRRVATERARARGLTDEELRREEDADDSQFWKDVHEAEVEWHEENPELSDLLTGADLAALTISATIEQILAFAVPHMGACGADPIHFGLQAHAEDRDFVWRAQCVVCHAESVVSLNAQETGVLIKFMLDKPLFFAAVRRAGRRTV